MASLMPQTVARRDSRAENDTAGTAVSQPPPAAGARSPPRRRRRGSALAGGGDVFRITAHPFGARGDDMPGRVATLTLSTMLAVAVGSSSAAAQPNPQPTPPAPKLEVKPDAAASPARASSAA